MTISTNILHPNTRVVVFDLDGTLYAKGGMVWRMMLALPCHWRKMLAERQTRKQLRGQWIGEQFYQKYFDEMGKNGPLSPAQAERWYQDVYMPQMVALIHRHYPLASWVMPFIEACQERDLRLVVLSDYGHTHEKLQALGIDPAQFDWVVSAPELGGLKPAPELMQQVAGKMQVQPSECLVIGDRMDTDGEMAKAVGAAFYWINDNK